MAKKNLVKHLKLMLRQLADVDKAEQLKRFFKTGKGHYAQHDRFIGVYVPVLRKIATEYYLISLAELGLLLTSKINEERLLAIFILIHQYNLGNEESKGVIYKFYLKNLEFVNNWNLVDASAPYIMGAYLINKDKEILLKLAHSGIMWEKRISIVSTFYFIRNNQFSWSLRISEILLQDPHDLIQKAVGWMLREIGKRESIVLEKFLAEHAEKMPRTMLRYAIERFSDTKRKYYLSMGK